MTNLNNLKRIDFILECCTSDSKPIEGLDRPITVIYNQTVISTEEVQELISTGEYEFSSRVVVTTPECADNLKDYKNNTLEYVGGNNMNSAEELMERLYKYSKDYNQGKVQDFEKVCSDCLLAASMIKQLRASKHTQKRARSRLSKKNREYRKELNNCYNRIHELKTQVSSLKEQLNDIRGEYNIMPERDDDKPVMVS